MKKLHAHASILHDIADGLEKAAEAIAELGPEAVEKVGHALGSKDVSGLAHQVGHEEKEFI
jgi:hypothetical protein